MIVVDNSVLVNVLIGHGDRAEATADRLLGEQLCAPELIDLEAVQAIRGQLLGGKITRTAARRAVADLESVPIERYPHAHLVQRIWEFRDNLTAYDAAYIALAERLACTLLTADRAMIGVPGARCSADLLAHS